MRATEVQNRHDFIAMLEQKGEVVVGEWYVKRYYRSPYYTATAPGRMISHNDSERMANALGLQ